MYDEATWLQSHRLLTTVLGLFDLRRSVALLCDFLVHFVSFLCDFQHKVVRIQGDHHIHLNKPEVVAPLVSEFLESTVLSQSGAQTDDSTSKL